MKVNLVWATSDIDERLAYMARVSGNQQQSEYARLIRFMIEHKHWSPFEMVSACFEITTSRAIGRQILRHRSFSFQEFSQRYAEVVASEPIVWRRQAEKNRQSSIDDLAEATRVKADAIANRVLGVIEEGYRELLALGIARECARMILPECATSRLYIAGNLRNWIHYVNLRTQEDTQLEHRLIAEAIKAQLCALAPATAQALGWIEEVPS